MTNDSFGITASGWIGTTINTKQYNQYNTRLIVLSQAITDKRIPKFISSGWYVFKSPVQMVCHWWISFFRQQIMQSVLVNRHYQKKRN